MITAVIVLGSITAWALTSRTLFRRWIRNDAFARYGARRAEVTCLAILAGLFLPVVLLTAFVTSNPPVSQRERDERIEELQSENAWLKVVQESRQQQAD